MPQPPVDSEAEHPSDGTDEGRTGSGDSAGATTGSTRVAEAPDGDREDHDTAQHDPHVTGVPLLRDTERVPPSLADPGVRALADFTGPRGRHSAPERSFWTPVRIAVLIMSITFGLAVLQKAPCMEQGWDRQNWRPFRALCYSDIGYLYQERGFGQGKTAFIESGNYPVLEYPVLTGAFMQVGAWITYAISDQPSDATTPVQMRSDATTFFTVNIAMLFICAIAMVICTVLTARGSPGDPGGRGSPTDGFYAAAAPVIIGNALINWDLFPVALTSGALLAWARKKPVLAGVLLGLGVAAKLYPLYLFGPLLVLCVRNRRFVEFGQCLGAGVVAWAAVNLPIYLKAPDNWKYFWQFNQDRPADYGSIGYLFKLSDHKVPLDLLNYVTLGLFVLMCAAIAFIGFTSPRPARLVQLSTLVVIAFLVTNKVYSPQYVLWLVPLVALARPRLRDWLIWQATEMFYWAMIWPHLANFLAPGDGGEDYIYYVATVVRILGQLYIAAMIIRDIYNPGKDPVRQGNIAHDPGGGVLNQPRAKPSPAYAANG